MLDLKHVSVERLPDVTRYGHWLHRLPFLFRCTLKINFLEINKKAKCHLSRQILEPH
jgi:hypothetical protein